MKPFFTLSLAIVLMVGNAQACVKKSAQTASSPLTVIVMDTTQALLNGAQVKIGKKTFTTSFDGRIVLKPEQWSGAKSISVSCEGYKDKSVAVDATGTVIVALTPKEGKRPKEDIYYSYGVTREAKSGAMIKTMAVGASADFAGVEEAEMAAVDDMIEKPFRPEPVPNNVSAGKLTAGEVNDFAKWTFWPTVIDSTHKSFIKDWRLSARQRYTVQVVDKHGYPIVNYPVNLTDAKGNTLYQTVTDNTGKAELWNGLITDSQQPKVERVFINGKEAKEWQTMEVDDSCEHTDDVDVVFVFDATGSMGDELRYLQAEMKDVIARAKDATGGLNIRTGAVVYRDHGDEYITRISRLTSDIKTTQAFIDKQHANGGGDFPEAVPEALMAALNSSGWNGEARARIAFLILDAPCHQDSATLALLHDQILNAAAQGVRIVPVVCSGLDKSGEFLLRTVALATNGTSFFLTDDSGIGHTHLKPTTDSLKVEHLNDMLVRTIVEFSYMPDCVNGKWHDDEIENIQEAFVPNPFEAKDLTEAERTARDSRTTLYLIDITGKLIYVYEGYLEDAGDSQLSRLHLPMVSTGVYFVKAFYDGEWHTKKILVH